jgi:hypothetical protein
VSKAGAAHASSVCFPQTPHHPGRRLRSCECGRLAGPDLHAVHIAGLLRSVPHGGCQATLHRVRRDRGRPLGNCGADIFRGNAAPGAAIESTAYNRPGRMDIRFGAAQETRANLGGARAEYHRIRNTTRIRDPAQQPPRKAIYPARASGARIGGL